MILPLTCKSNPRVTGFFLGRHGVVRVDLIHTSLCLVHPRRAVQKLKDVLDDADKARKAALATAAVKGVEELLAAGGVGPIAVQVLNAGASAKVCRTRRYWIMLKPTPPTRMHSSS